jgi:hypothetical protein
MVRESRLESRVSLSTVGFQVHGVPVIAVGSAVNRSLFNGLVEEQISGRWYDAVFDNGHRMTPWAPMRHR